MKASFGGFRAAHAALGLGSACLAFTLAACASGVGDGPPITDGGPDPVVLPDGSATPVGIDTVLERSTISAGEAVPVRCQLLDENGDTIVAADEDAFIVSYEPESLFDTNEAGQTIGAQAGEGTVRCTHPMYGLSDDTPATVTVVPGDVTQVVTQLDKDVMVAGESATATCLGFDAFGNPVMSFDWSLAVSPQADGTTVEGAQVTVTRSGPYEVTCQAMGAQQVDSAVLEVLPALPASISVSLDPDEPVYKINDTVTLLTSVLDSYGNTVNDATLDFTSSGSASVESLGMGRFRLLSEGTVTLTATVTSATEGDVALSGSASLDVNQYGPSIECVSPGDAVFLHKAPGSTIDFVVGASDSFPVQSVTINGSTATQNTSGDYVASVTTQFGMNFVDVVATDNLGEENSKTCTFLASDRWLGEDAYLDGGVALRLNQAAVDDNADPSAYDSLGDLLEEAIDSGALVDIIDQALIDQGVLAEQGCLLDTARARYKAGTLSYSSGSASLQLIDGGLSAHIEIDDVYVGVDLSGCTCSDGSITADRITADVDLALSVVGGVPQVSLVGSPSTGISGFDTHFGGVCGWLISLFEGTVESELRSALSGFLETDLVSVLNEALGGFDIGSLGSSFSIPRLDGGSLTLDFGVRLNSANTTPTRLLLALGTRFQATAAHARSSLGIPLRQGQILLDPPGTSSTSPVGLSLHEGVLNQVLHTLWRGGFFDATIDGDTLGEPGASAELTSRLPPVAVISGGSVSLMLGGVRASVVIPGIIDEPLNVTFGGYAGADVTLSNGDLSFGNVTLNQLFVSFEEPLSQSQRDILESFLTRILENVLTDAINDGLPAIPIPTFTLPDSVSDFGLPPGLELGITNPSLTTSGQHYVLTGSFGSQ